MKESLGHNGGVFIYIKKDIRFSINKKRYINSDNIEALDSFS